MKRLMKIEIEIGSNASIFRQSLAVKDLLLQLRRELDNDGVHLRDGQTGRGESKQWTAVSATWSVEAEALDDPAAAGEAAGRADMGAVGATVKERLNAL